MLARIMKLVCIVALLLTALLWRFAPNYQLLLNLVLCVGSLVVFAQAVRAREYFWQQAFLLLLSFLTPFASCLSLLAICRSWS